MIKWKRPIKQIRWVFQVIFQKLSRSSKGIRNWWISITFLPVRNHPNRHLFYTTKMPKRKSVFQNSKIHLKKSAELQAKCYLPAELMKSHKKGKLSNSRRCIIWLQKWIKLSVKYPAKIKKMESKLEKCLTEKWWLRNKSIKAKLPLF